MSHTDPELFELCNEVYKRTGWDSDVLPSIYETGMEHDQPLYTSDYLLEKLYAYKPSMFVMDDGSWCVMPTDKLADHRASVVLARNADIPLKALLKLTIALKDAGELDA